MSRVLTISELYGLLLQEPKALEFSNPTIRPIQLNRGSTVFWAAPEPPVARPARRVGIAAPVMHMMEVVADACGITEVDAWTEAAHAWMVQRQCDMADLATPNGQELALQVRRIWSTIDEQMGDIRGQKQTR